MNGEAQPPGYYKQSFLCEAFRILNTNYAMLSDTIDRSTHWQRNIDSLSTRMNQFTEQFESRCTTATGASKSTIEQTANYKLFDQEFDPSYLPTYFQYIYAQSQEKLKTRKNAILIDIGSESEVTLNENNSHICDKIETLDLSSPGDQLNLSGGENLSLEALLSPPLAPEVIASNKN